MTTFASVRRGELRNRVATPNAVIPIAVVGLNFGNRIIELLRRPAIRRLFRIEALCDLDVNKARETALPLGAKAYGSLDDLLADDAIRAVALITGPSGRSDLLRKIIRAGKDVITTKPFETDPQAAAAVLQEAAERKRVIHLNSPAPLLSPDLEQILRWRKEYDLGHPVGARADAWGDYHEEADGSWYDDPSRCPLAPVFRIGIYLINDLVRLMGPIDAVQAFHTRLRTGRPTPDNGQLSLRFVNGALGQIYNSFCIDDGQAYRNTLTLNFERGTIYRNAPPAFHSVATHDDCSLLLVTHRRGRKIVRRRPKLELSGAYQWTAFHRAVAGEDLATLSGASTAEEIVHGLSVISAMSRAEKSGCTEKVESEERR